MNAQTPSPTTPPVPMTKEKIVKDDGRFLYYYTFPTPPPPPMPGVSKETREDADV